MLISIYSDLAASADNFLIILFAIPFAVSFANSIHRARLISKPFLSPERLHSTNEIEKYLQAMMQFCLHADGEIQDFSPEA